MEAKLQRLRNRRLKYHPGAFEDDPNDEDGKPSTRTSNVGDEDGGDKQKGHAALERARERSRRESARFHMERPADAQPISPANPKVRGFTSSTSHADGGSPSTSSASASSSRRAVRAVPIAVRPSANQEEVDVEKSDKSFADVEDDRL